MRCFIALNVSEKTKKEIYEKIISQIDSQKFKLVEQENLHITMRFLGEITEEKANELKEKLNEINSGFKEFKIEFSGINAFKPNVLWIGITKGIEEVNELNEALEKIGLKDERFHVHLTIGRNRNANEKEFNSALNALQKINFSAKEKINSIDLMESELSGKGPIYSKI